MLYYLDLDYLDSSKTSIQLTPTLSQGTVYQRNPLLTKNGVWGHREWLFVDPGALIMGDSYADSLAGTFQVGGEAADHVPGCRAASHQPRLRLLIPAQLTRALQKGQRAPWKWLVWEGSQEECRGGCGANAGMVMHPGEIWEGFITFPWWQGGGGVVLQPPGKL